ncbi:unnamed protein product [Phytophthora lilii]|uniref:Unnamed protein product n=1 Tax=Phytophthora lilii TaxID=2077276 RepID=A0A9W7CNE2_9STRA|nr:unnamed protein product [Phytophthora lilii]
MEIVTVDRWLLQLAAVDEEESEAVAISCVEFILSEANAYFRQQCLAREAVRAVSCRLRHNVLDTVFAAALDAEQALDGQRFEPEIRPDAEPKDRHAVRSVPLRSPEKTISPLHAAMAKSSSSPASWGGSSPEKLWSRVVASPTRRRRKAEKGIVAGMMICLVLYHSYFFLLCKGVETEKTSVATAPVQTIEKEIQDEEKPEVKEWREKCLKSLETSTKKPGFSKWVTIARAFSVPDNRVSMEVGVIAAPPPNLVAALAATPVRTKTNVNSFSSILDPSEKLEEDPVSNEDIIITSRRTSRRPSAVLESTARSLQPISTIHSIAENPQRQSKRRSQSASVDSTVQRRKTTLLTDSLSRRKLTRKPSSSESLSGNSNSGWNSSRTLWRYEQEPGSATSRTFIADGTEFNACNLPATISVASGVVLSQGESVIEGPEWVENSTTMSRKRFDHLTPSLSTPSIRVRTSAASCKSGGSRNNNSEAVGSNRSICTVSGSHSSSHASLEKHKTRPSTALRAVAGPPRLTAGHTRATSAAPGNARSLPATSMKSAGAASAKYLREFPKPRPGVIRVVNDQAMGMVNGVDDRQRTAWMS